ncbi:AI-2E family transporter [Pleurocapsales cyanobacterium LEGE 06147]|nr:AI-2E family transporter [Pleurocapsales cyanobacterium LEGE 06147]
MNKLPNDPTKNEFWNRISTNALVRFLLMFASGWALLTIFQYFENILFIFSVAAIIAFLLNYPVRYLEQFLGRGFALSIVIFLTLLVIISLIIGLGLYVLAQSQRLIDLFIERLSSPENPLDWLNSFLAARNIKIDFTPLEQSLQNFLTSSFGFVIGTLSSLPNTFLTFVIILVVSFFMLIDGGKLWQLVLKIFPPRQRERFSTVVEESFVGFFRGQIILSFLLSLATFFVFVVARIPFALTLSMIMGFLDAIPGVGATLGLITVSFIVLVNIGWASAFKVIVACLILQQIQDNFVAPRVMQSTVNLNPVVVFFALMLGAKVAGLWGIFLSVPIAAMVVKWLEIEEIQASRD